MEEQSSGVAKWPHRSLAASTCPWKSWRQVWQKRPTLLTQGINDNENPNNGLLLSTKDNYMKRNILENRPMTTHTETICCVQLDAPVQVQRQESHNCWMRCWSDEFCPPLCQPRCLSAVRLVPALAGRTPARVPAPRVNHGAHIRTCIGALDIHLLASVLKWELVSSWKWQVTICYAYCKGLKTNASARCNPVRFGEPRGKSSHTIVYASFAVSIIFPCLWKMLTTCDILSNFKRNGTLPRLRGR